MVAPGLIFVHKSLKLSNLLRGYNQQSDTARQTLRNEYSFPGDLSPIISLDQLHIIGRYRLTPPRRCYCTHSSSAYSSSCAYSLSKSARHLRTSSGVSTDLSSSSSSAEGGHVAADDSGGENEAGEPRSSLVLCGASGTTWDGTSQIPRLLSSQKRCRSCVWGCAPWATRVSTTRCEGNARQRNTESTKHVCVQTRRRITYGALETDGALETKGTQCFT